MIETESRSEARVNGNPLYDEKGELTPFGDQLRRVSYWTMMVDHTYIGDPNLKGFLIDKTYGILSDESFWPGDIDSSLEPTVSEWSKKYFEFEERFGPEKEGFLPSDLAKEWYKGKSPRIMRFHVHKGEGIKSRTWVNKPLASLVQ